MAQPLFHFDRYSLTFPAELAARIPEPIKLELISWVRDAARPGPFIDALLLGDVYGAVKCAKTPEELAAIPYIAQWLWWCAPIGTVRAARDHELRRELLYTYRGLPREEKSAD